MRFARIEGRRGLLSAILEDGGKKCVNVDYGGGRGRKGMDKGSAIGLS